MSYAMKKWKMDNHIARVKQKKSVSRQDVQGAMDIIKTDKVTHPEDEAELMGKFLHTAYTINPVATGTHVNHFYQKIAANDGGHSLRKCLERARRGERSRQNFCRMLPNKRAKALCWGAVYLSSAAWKGFCYAIYDDE